MAANDPSVRPADAALRRIRVGLWVVVAALGIAAVIVYAVTRSSSDAAAPVVPADEQPAATWAPGEQRAPPFTLRDATGKPFSLASLRGRPVLVTFIDPLCRDYCPTEARRLNDVVRAFPAAQKPAVVAVSVNVYGNAPHILREDGRKWSLVPQWRWGVGSGSQLSRVWDAYHVQVMVAAKTIAGTTVHQIGHTEAAYLIDANGDERALFLWPYTSDGVVRALQGLASAS